jgi:hypothetical protein
VDLAHCAACGVPTDGTYRCLRCERNIVAASTARTSVQQAEGDAWTVAPAHVPLDAVGALVTLGINGRPGSIGRGIGIAVGLMVAGVAVYIVVLGVISSIQS